MSPTGGDLDVGIRGEGFFKIQVPDGTYAYTRDGSFQMDAQGRIVHKRKSGMPYMKRYLDESKGRALQDVWTDIGLVRAWGGRGERLGYPTQKPLELLERVIAVSSNPGDIVLDPFCGCGTALVASQKLDRKWIGIDITYLSIAVMKARLTDSFGLTDVEVIGQPTEVEGALAMPVGNGLEGRYQFPGWAVA